MILKESLIEIREITAGKIDITDPCYSEDASLRINNIALPAGKYKLICFKGWEYEQNELDKLAEMGITATKESEPEDLRHRIFSIMMKKPSCKNASFSSKRWEQIGQIGVDSGMAGFFWNLNGFADDDEYFDFIAELDDNDGVMVSDRGFYCSSGYGDGIYDVFAIKQNNEIIALRIDF